MLNRAFAVMGFTVLGAANAPAQLQAPRWHIDRDVFIGGSATGASEVDVVGGITIGPDGSVYVAQPKQSIFLVFESDGRLRGSLGQLGAGPGEFRAINTFGWIGDTLWVADYAQRRMVFFDSKGRHLRTVPDPPPPGSERALVVALLSNGWLLTQQGISDVKEVTAKLAIQSAGGAASDP